MNLSQASQQVAVLILNQVWPVMFANLSLNSYWILAGFMVISFTLVFSQWPETKGVSLEHIGPLFGYVDGVEVAAQKDRAAHALDLSKMEKTPEAAVNMLRLPSCIRRVSRMSLGISNYHRYASEKVTHACIYPSCSFVVAVPSRRVPQFRILVGLGRRRTWSLFSAISMLCDHPQLPLNYKLNRTCTFANHLNV